jgi:hypothetical protein
MRCATFIVRQIAAKFQSRKARRVYSEPRGAVPSFFPKHFNRGIASRQPAAQSPADSAAEVTGKSQTACKHKADSQGD